MNTVRDSQPLPATGEPTFAALENDVDGLVANTRISFALTTVSRAADRGDWTAAIDALASLADKLAGYAPPAQVWRELVSAVARYGIRGADIGAVNSVFAAYFDRAWSDDSRQTMPWQLHAALQEADRRGRFEAGRQLGALIDRLSVCCPLGPFATAHFRERRLHTHGQPIDIAQVADDFERAARLADDLEMPTTRRLGLLRAGVVLLRTDAARQRGRQLLGDVDAAELSRAEALWYAVGMVHSSFWLDRVRAADAVIAAADADPDPTRQPAVADAAGYLLNCTPIELHPLEIDRLKALSQQMGLADRSLRLRSHLEGIASAPARRAREAADILAHSADGRLTDRQRASIDFTRTAGRLLSADGDEQSADIHVSGDIVADIGEVFPTAAAVLESLATTIHGDMSKLATSLGQLEGRIRTSGNEPGSRATGPFAILWPQLLPAVRRLRSAPEDTDDTTLSRIVGSTTTIMSRWLPGAPTPGYGWWALAAHLASCDMHEQAATAARRAIDDGESVDDELEQRVLAELVDWAVRHGDPADMLEWLDTAEQRLAS